MGLGIDTKNWQRCLRIAETINHYGRPFVMGGDFNNSIAGLDATGWPASMQGRIMGVGSAELGTCRSSQGNWSNIDFFLVSRQLQQAVEFVQCVGSECPKPHLPIRLKLNEKPRQFRERALKKVKQFPCYVPCGPPRAPPDWDTESTVGNLKGQEKIDALCKFVVSTAEIELSNLYDIEEQDQPDFQGRFCKPKFVWRHTGGAPGGGRYPVSDGKGRTCRLVQRRMEDAILAWDRLQFSVVFKSLQLADEPIVRLGGSLWLIDGSTSWPLVWAARLGLKYGQ